MVSFQYKLAEGLAKRGFDVCYDLTDEPYQAVLVIGGTRRLDALWHARQRGVPIIQRLNGMNWIHRLPQKKGQRQYSLRHFLRAEYGNLLLSSIRGRLAQRIVYQSEFSRCWWERVYGPVRASSQVVYNGVNLDQYTPQGGEQPPEDGFRLLLVEGSLIGDYEMGLEVAIQLRQELEGKLAVQGSGRWIELVVVGRISPELQTHWEKVSGQGQSLHGPPIHWAGLVPRERIPEFDRSAHLLYSADINAACPNSVIEAMACGLPVVSFDTGALPELIAGDAGRVAAYGGDPWKLEPPDVAALARAAEEILGDLPRFRTAARQRAETAFSLDQMVDGYLQVLLG